MNKILNFLNISGIKIIGQVEAAEAVPIESIMIETDAPYMAPVPHRGERCDSSLVVHTCEKLAEIKGVTAEECARITMENGKRFFGIR